VRLLHAADYNGATAGSFVPMLCAFAKYVNEQGRPFAVVVPRIANATWYDQLRDAGAELFIANDVAAAITVIRNWEPDVVHIHFYGWQIPVTAGLFFKRSRIFWHAHSVVHWDRPLLPSLRTVAKYRILGSRVERIVAVSHAIKAELVRVGAPESRIVVVHNAVDPARFRPPTRDERAIARARLDLNADRAILFFGRNPALKGADVLQEALLALSRPTIITVATPAETNNALAARARVIAIDRVEDVVPLLWAADVLAMPSRGEGFPLVLLESAMAGLPIAASDLPALREAAGEHSGVHFARVGDGAALAIALRQALASPRAESSAPSEVDPMNCWVRSIADLYQAS
jgi:glycosyltransferase involved in cell wall biosynthesis